MQCLCLCDQLCVLITIGSLATGVGCGSINEAHRPPDAAADSSSAPPDSSPPDAAAQIPRCDPNKPFGAPTNVMELNSPARDQGAKLVDDGLTIYFGSDRMGTGLYKATRNSLTELFGTPVALTAINATGAATGPSLTGDGLTLYYALIPPGQTTGDIYVTTRSDKASDFPPGTPVAQVNSTIDDLDPFITEDGAALYFDSARGQTSLHLYVTVRRGDRSFDVPQPLTSLNTTLVDGHPVLSGDGRTLYWSSTRTDGGAQGLTDIWMATRPSPAGTFGAPTRIPELSTASGESVSWIAPDGCEVYLQSDRPGGLGSQDIWVALKPM